MTAAQIPSARLTGGPARTGEPAQTGDPSDAPGNVPTGGVGRRAWVVLAVGVLAYILTVMQRTTLSAAGLEAAQRFSISPGALSIFVFIQVAVYVLAQIPAGLLVDRWGARPMLVASGVLLSLGQLLLAHANGLGTAVPARVLVGSGDAIVFASVFALVPRWFPAGRVPVVTQFATILGQLGQILSAVPFAALLVAAGWSVAFTSAAAASLLAAVLVLAVIRNGPGWSPAPATSAQEILAQLRGVWRRPGTRVGFFGHMATQFSMMVFALLWGIPYLVSAQHLSTRQAGGLITAFVLCSIAIGPVIGLATQRHPLRRSWLLLTVVALQATVWTVVLLLPGEAPRWLLVVLVVALSTGGPGSVVGIDIARTANPGRNLAVAQCIVNLGGFCATLFVLAAMGLLLTSLGGFTPQAFRIAWLVQYPVWALAVTGLVLNRRHARRIDAERGIVPRPILQVLAAGRSGR